MARQNALKSAPALGMKKLLSLGFKNNPTPTSPPARSIHSGLIFTHKFCFIESSPWLVSIFPHHFFSGSKRMPTPMTACKWHLPHTLNDRKGAFPVTSGEFDPVAKFQDDSLFSLPRLSAGSSLLRMSFG